MLFLSANIYLEIGVIIFLCLLIVLLLWQQEKQLRQQTTRDQNEKIIQALQAYPVHQYTMAHMLERCLVIIFSAPQMNLLPKGAVFLLQDEKLSLLAKRGFTGAHDDKHLDDYLCDRADRSDKFQFIPSTGLEHGYYILPLVRRNDQLGLLILYTQTNDKATDDVIKFVKSMGNTISNLIERKQISDELRLGNSVINLSQQAIFITDTDNKIIRCNESCERITGYSSKELIGQNPKIFQSEYHTINFYKTLWREVNNNGFWQGEIWNKRKDDSVFPEWLTISIIKDADGQVVKYMAIFTDLSSIKNAEKNIQQLSFYDPLTQLPNRALFKDRVQQSIVQAERQNNQFALLCLDIDHFKKVNESLGHEEGDKLLQIFADRITNVLRKEDAVARIGGDEFAMIIHDLNEDNSGRVLHVVEKTLHCLKEVVQLDEHEIIATGSIGISFYPEDADNAVDLIKYADTAMFQAKQAGRNGYQFYTKKFNQQALRKIRLESALRRALKQSDFEIFLQGQQELDSHLLIGAEALLRVGRGELSSISPAEYIPIAEESGLIVDIGDWVFSEVCRLLRHWYDNNLLPLGFKRIAINISPVQFERHDFIKKIQQCIQETCVPVQHLEIELTESSLQESTHSVIEKLVSIKAIGINIAIDDFGTGYSSLSRLKQFPIDLLKIDRSFVADICGNESDMAIIKAIISMASALDIRTLAEGVETQEQADILETLQCSQGQGFLFSKPVNTENFEAILASVKKSSKSILESVA